MAPLYYPYAAAGGGKHHTEAAHDAHAYGHAYDGSMSTGAEPPAGPAAPAPAVEGKHGAAAAAMDAGIDIDRSSASSPSAASAAAAEAAAAALARARRPSAQPHFVHGLQTYVGGLQMSMGAHGAHAALDSKHGGKHARGEQRRAGKAAGSSTASTASKHVGLPTQEAARAAAAQAEAAAAALASAHTSGSGSTHAHASGSSYAGASGGTRTTADEEAVARILQHELGRYRSHADASTSSAGAATKKAAKRKERPASPAGAPASPPPPAVRASPPSSKARGKQRRLDPPLAGEQEPPSSSSSSSPTQARFRHGHAHGQHAPQPLVIFRTASAGASGSGGSSGSPGSASASGSAPHASPPPRPAVPSTAAAVAGMSTSTRELLQAIPPLFAPQCVLPAPPPPQTPQTPFDDEAPLALATASTARAQPAAASAVWQSSTHMHGTAPTASPTAIGTRPPLRAISSAPAASAPALAHAAFSPELGSASASASISTSTPMFASASGSGPASATASPATPLSRSRSGTDTGTGASGADDYCEDDGDYLTGESDAEMASGADGEGEDGSEEMSDYSLGDGEDVYYDDDYDFDEEEYDDEEAHIERERRAERRRDAAEARALGYGTAPALLPPRQSDTQELERRLRVAKRKADQDLYDAFHRSLALQARAAAAGDGQSGRVSPRRRTSGSSASGAAAAAGSQGARSAADSPPPGPPVTAAARRMLLRTENGLPAVSPGWHVPETGGMQQSYAETSAAGAEQQQDQQGSAPANAGAAIAAPDADGRIAVPTPLHDEPGYIPLCSFPGGRIPEALKPRLRARLGLRPLDDVLREVVALHKKERAAARQQARAAKREKQREAAALAAARAGVDTQMQEPRTAPLLPVSALLNAPAPSAQGRAAGDAPHESFELRMTVPPQAAMHAALAASQARRDRPAPPQFAPPAFQARRPAPVQAPPPARVQAAPAPATSPPRKLALAPAPAVASRAVPLKDMPHAPVFQTQPRYRLDQFDLMDKALGTGTFGSVLLAKYKPGAASDPRSYFAVKVLSKKGVLQARQLEHTHSEKDIMSKVSHPFIVALFSAFQDKHNLYMLMEYVPGGEIFALLRRVGRFPAEQARFYAANIVLALEHLHARDIVYRDLKPENLLLRADGYVKLADLGFSKQIADRAWTVCGTPEYLAPEIVQSLGHAKEVDCWALAVLLFEMLAGYPPFYANTSLGVYESILRGIHHVDFPPAIDAAAADLIRGLLQPSTGLRLGTRDIKQHPWFAGIDWAAIERAQVPAPFVPAPVDMEALWRARKPISLDGMPAFAPKDTRGTQAGDPSVDRHFRTFGPMCL